MTWRFFLIAGEPSGDQLGAALMKGLKTLSPENIEFYGIGGPLMQAEGLQTLFPMHELSVLGLAEILGRLRHLLRRVRDASNAVLEWQPDVLITIDIPEFSFRVAAHVKARMPDLRTIHYVAPTVWAWRPKRARKMAQFTDHVLALFPFEPPYMQAAGMSCDFVGHPVAAMPQADPAEIAVFRAHLNIKDGNTAPIIALLPGSRRAEVERLMPIFGRVAAALAARHPKARLVLPAAPAVVDLVDRMLRAWPVDAHMIDPRGKDTQTVTNEKRIALGAAHAALAASGTVSLELAAASTPMVIAYNASWLSRAVVAPLLRVDTVTLVNLVSETRAVPEFLNQNCQPAPMVAALDALIRDETARTKQLNAMALTMERLGKGGQAPGLRAAQSVLSVM